MKHNSVWGKLLLLALSFVLAFSTLVSCTKDDIDALDKETDEIKTSLSTTAEDLANLKTLVNSIKATADAAAAKTALDAAIADLEAVKTTADAAATAKALADAKTAIEAAYASADAAVKTELETAINAVKATADAAATAKALADAKTALEAAIADKADKAALDAAIANINALLDEQVTAEDVAAAVKVVDDKLADYAKAADVATLTTALNEVAAKVEAIATDVKTLKDQVAALQAAIADKTDVNGIKDQLVVINAAIAALQGDSNKFADEYELASRVLFGELVVYVVDGECFAVEADKVPEGVTANLRSIDAFKALVASVKDADYADGVLDEFKAIAATQEFFLGRAISVEAIEKCFAAVETEKGSLETLVETLERVLYKDSCKIVLTPTHNCDKTDGTHTEYCIKSVEKVYNKIVANNIEISDKLEARYDLLVAAYNNMVAAEAASEAIENMVLAADATVLYRDKASVLPAVEAYDNFKGTYFGADKLAYTVFYGPSSVTAEDLASALIANYDVMRKHEARLYELEEAGKAAATLSASFTSAEWYDEQRPLYTKAATLADEVKAFKAWIAEYTLEEVNVERIVNDKYEILCVASDYATAMNKIWETYNEKGVKASIIDAIAALKGAEDVTKTLITEEDAVAAIRVLVNGLEVAIKAVDINDDQVADYTAKDGNFVAMVGDLANFVAIEERIDELNDANAELDAIYAEMVDLIAENIEETGKGVTFEDWDKMVAWEAEIAEIYASVKVQMKAEDANYVAIEKEKPATEKLAELYEIYEEITEDVRVIYLAVTEALADADAVSLKFGYDLDGYMTKILEIMALNVKDINLPLGEKEGKEINLQTLMNDLSKAIANYKERATEAQTAAAALKALITADAFTNLKATTLNDYAAIEAVYEQLVAWVVEYITPDVTDINDDAAVVAALKALLDVPVYGDKTGAKWVFLAADVYTACVEKFDAAAATKTAAKGEWEGTAGLKALLQALSNNDNAYNIHKLADYKAAAEKFVEYRNEFYGNAITSPEFDENAIFNTFSGFKTICETQDSAAAGKIQAILDAIDALPALDETTFTTILDQIDDIEDLIEEYKTGYCADICADCIEPEVLLGLAKQKAAAQLVEYAYAAKQNANDATDALIDNDVFMFDGLITKATTYDQIDSLLSSGKSQILNNYPCVVDTTKDHTYGNDCVCDYCDNVRVCVDAAEDGDHKCDNCGAADITTCADAADDGDHKCDECAEVMAGATCADAADDGNHNCDECGAAIEGASHIDNNLDTICDECGQDGLPRYE